MHVRLESIILKFSIKVGAEGVDAQTLEAQSVDSMELLSLASVKPVAMVPK